jgi:anti-anti-sigma factor
MNISLRSNEGDTVEFEVAGRVDHRDLAQSTDILTELVGEDVYRRNILIDMSQIPMLDSSGVGWFLNRHKLCKEAGGQLVLHSLSTMTQNVFKVLNMHMVLKIAADKKAAEQITKSV